jgi:hypothetical protein
MTSLKTAVEDTEAMTEALLKHANLWSNKLEKQTKNE